MTLDGTFNSLLLSGGCVADQVDTVIEVDVGDVLEARESFAWYESQMMDPHTRSSVRSRQYEFAASFSFQGDVLDFAMDGGITLTPRRQRVEENGVRGEYSVVLNRKPLDDVTVRADVVQLANANGTKVQQLRLPSDTYHEILFTESNWNREQIIRVTAVDDAIAEGVHYSVITHSSLSLDPNFDGVQTPFLYGRNITMQVEDDDFAGIKLSRTHMYVGEGGLNDTYDVVLTSQPWYPVFVTVLPLHANQTQVSEPLLTFIPETWNIAQTVTVSAVDDTLSEVEYGGLHYGGQLLHYSESKDFRYHSRRPQCFDIPNCDPASVTDCLLPGIQTQELPTRVCDVTSDCGFTLGNGACVARVFSGIDRIPARFGRPALDPSLHSSPENAEASIAYTALRDILQEQELDGEVSGVRNISTELSFVAPPAELRGFVLSLLGLLNLDQAQTLGKSPRRTLHAVCGGIERLETHRWAFEEWPSGYVDRVLQTILQTFPGTIDERRLWNCGASVFRPGNSINVTVWDNDPGVTLSTTSLTVKESAEDGAAESVATYSIVLNASPSSDGGPLEVANSMCSLGASDRCGFWDDFATTAATMYAEKSTANVSIAIIANSQIKVSPSLVTFTASNWFVPQRVTVHAVDDDIAEANATYTITHRVQNSAHRYTNTTPFWFEGTFQAAPPLVFPNGTRGADSIPYNMIPTLLNSPSHQRINVHVHDNDKAGVEVIVAQPEGIMRTKESSDTIDWIGDYATSYAFSDISLSAKSGVEGGLGVGTALQNFLVLGPNSTSFMKFHLPHTHEGDSKLAFSFATLRLYQTPFKIFNVSDTTDDSAASSSDDDAGLFTKLYRLRISLVQNSWSRESVGAAADSTFLPSDLQFVASKFIEVTAVLEESRSIEVDVTSLVAQLLPTRAAVASFKIEVVDGLENAMQSVTQICSSVFEQKLRPTLQLRYRFPNLLLGNPATQSSTATSADVTSSFPAATATDGDRSVNKSTATESETEPWWETCFAETTKVGQIALFVPESMYTGPSDSEAVHIVVVASLQELHGGAMSLEDALQFGCPEACPSSHRVAVRKGIILRDIQAGVRCLRIYREQSGPLELVEVEAYDAFVSVSPTADGSGLRSRGKTDWTAQKVSDSWRVQQSAKHSEDDNLAIGMKTRQSSTSPASALSNLAADGRRASTWDALVVQDGDVESVGGNGQVMEPGSTRTELETDPWWEVDLGSIKAISSVVLYPFTGENGRGFCSQLANASDKYPAWSGDLYSFSKTDSLLMLEEPFRQEFEVVITDTSIAAASDPASVAVSRRTTLAFSCEDGTTSIAWADAFTKGRFVTVRKHGLGVLMLNEVEVYRWNPGSTSRYVLLDFFGVGDKPMALSSVKLFPPTDAMASSTASGGFAAPISFDIHSVSSQLSSTGAGSAVALSSVLTSDCYIAAKASFHEWVVLDLLQPTNVGLIELDTTVDKCGSNVAPIHSISIAGYGSNLDGMRSEAASAALAASSDNACEIDSMGVVQSASLSSCTRFICGDASCNSHLAAVGTSSTLVMSDFCDLVLFGVIELLPLARLPLSQNEHRALILRDHPVALWAFDELPKVLIVSGAADAKTHRATGVLAFTSVETARQLLIDDAREDTFFSNAVLVQAAMPAFSLEFWLRFTHDPMSSLDTPMSIVTVSSESIGFASLGISRESPGGYFTLVDPDSGESCQVAIDEELPSPATQIWYHVVASYDPTSATISLALRFRLFGGGGDPILTSATASCTLAMFSVSKKALHFGAYTTSAGGRLPGFVGQLSNVAWYVHVLGRSEMLDHYHDFLSGVTDAKTVSHNSYALRLTSKPLTPVLIDINAESLCYRFNLCNVSVIPSAVVISPENWKELRNIHIVATRDQLFEGAHTTELQHEAFSEPAYQLVSSATTTDLLGRSSGSSTDRMSEYQQIVSGFYEDLRVTRILDDPDVLQLRESAIAELHAKWSSQQLEFDVVVNDPYNETLQIANLTVDLIDATVPGVEFSTSSLVVSEDGKANDYQVLLRSEPTSIVEIALSVEAGCYRPCYATPLCPSQAVTESQDTLACGDASSPTRKLCNITISPSTLYFSISNWSIPQTVRVVAVDDQLDEDDLHLTSIKATSLSADPVYDNLFLPDIVVAIEDNDVTEVLYSAKHTTLAEKDSGSMHSIHNYPTGTFYTLRLATEPWANVTIAMSNEANGSCYRPCGYHFDTASCGLPRQQSVTSVRVSTNSTREIHQISLSMPKVIEVQRIVTYAEHVDQIYRLGLTGGFVEEVQVIVFQFDSAFKVRFKSADAINNAVTYDRAFRIGASDRSTSTISLDGFSSAAKIEAALDTLFKQTGAFRVARTLLYDQFTLTWAITFARLLRVDGTFPLLSVAADSAFEGTLSASRSSACVAPSGSFRVRYGATDAVPVEVPALVAAADFEGALRDLDAVYAALVTRSTHPSAYGFVYTIAFTSVDAYHSLQVDASSTLVAAPQSADAVSLVATQVRAPVLIDGMFQVAYFSAFNSTNNVTHTQAIPWNATAQLVKDEISRINGIGNVSVSRRQLTAEGGMEWTVEFTENNGQMDPLTVTPLNLTGQEVAIVVDTVRDGESLGGSYYVEMGGWFKKTDPRTQRVYWMDIQPRNTTSLPFNISAVDLQQALFDLSTTELTVVTREDLDCDAFAVCNGYTWTISYRNSPGDLPPIHVYGRGTLSGQGAVITSATIANGTYIGGQFSLKLDLFDIDKQVWYSGKTWDLPVNVSAEGMDQALEAIPFVRSNREAEFDPETRLWRGIKFDKGVRVYRDGPYLDGGHTWRLEWAIEDYIRFQDLQIAINASLVTQEVEPLEVPSEYDLDGSPRCSAIPTARFEPDRSDPFELRGWCVYDITNVTIQERFLCNYTVENPWVVFTPENWCIPQKVFLSSVDDFIDEETVENGNVTFSNVTHTVLSDDMVYTKLALDPVVVEVESDDFAEVLVSETYLEVSEDGSRVAQYMLQLKTEPLYGVKIVVLPWLDGRNTGCYRFGLCNLTIPVDEFVFTPRNWDIPQTVVIEATDDDLDEYDAHATGISHISYSDDLKYHEIDIPTINVTVFDNDVSAFKVLKTSVAVAEGGAFDEYDVVLGTEPFAKVTIDIANIGAVGNLATASPNRLLFTWKNWNVSQTVRVDAFDDFTEDPKDSSSVLVHTISSHDVNYARLPNLAHVDVFITDNDVSGISLSTNTLHAKESNTTIHTYGVRLNTEPWHPVVLSPNADHGCYVRVLTSETLCNATILSRKLYFGAGNWSVWQNVSLLAFDDWLTEAPVHQALITHSTASKDPLYQVSDYSASSGNVQLLITDNDFSFVNISLRTAGESERTQLHVAEGGFNDSYRIFLNSEPYEDVQLTLRPKLEEFINLDDKSLVRAAQVGTVYRTSSSIAVSSPNAVRDIELVFTALDWFQPRVIQVFAIDDKISEDPTQYSSIIHEVSSADANYNISNSSIGVASVAVMVNDKEAIPPPIPISAVFDASGSKVQVTFDSTVYHADSMTVRPAARAGDSLNMSSLYLIKLKQFPCNLVFDFGAAKYSLGTGAACLWLDLKSLRIELGSSATITAKDVLLLNECSAFANQYCQSTSVIRARHTSRSYTQASIAVQLPSDIVKPKVVLIAPEDAGSCGLWTVDASLSQGAGGRAFAQMYWFALPKTFFLTSSLGNAEMSLARAKLLYASLDSLCVKYAADWKSGTSSSVFVPKADLTANPDLAFVSLMAQLRSACYLRSVAQTATDTRSLKIEIDSTLLEPGVGYFVGLELVNAFTQRTTLIKAVQLRSLPGPALFVVGDSSLEVTRVGDPIVLQVNATVSCTELIGTQVGYVWSVFSAPLGTSAYTPANDLQSKNTAKDPRVFRIPRTALDAEKSYRFQVEAYMRSGRAKAKVSNSSAVISVDVGVSALSAVVAGGNRVLGGRDTLVLSANSSFDPDLSATPFTYSWGCADITNSSLSQPCVNASAAVSATGNPTVLDFSKSTGAVLSVAPFNVQLNRTLHFTLTVAKAPSLSGKPRTASASATVWTLPGSVPDVAISASSAKVSPSSRVALSAQVKSTYPYTSRWVQVQGDLDLGDGWEVNGTTHNDAFALPLTSLNNVILKNKLTGGMTYTFGLIATDINGNAGFGTITIKVNAPPSSGRIEIAPKSGYAIQDQFSLSCLEWTDETEDLPLRYSFGVMSKSNFDALVGVANDSTQLGALLRTKSVPLVSDHLVPTVTVSMLPPTAMKDSEEVVVIAFISDNLGSFVHATASVQVLLPPEAKSNPIAFVGNLLENGSVVDAADASRKGEFLLSAASILEGAFTVGSSDTNSCTAQADPASVCSGHGACDPGTVKCVCQRGYLGVNCEFSVSAVQSVNAELLASLASSAQVVEPTTSALSQQAVTMDTVIQASPSAFAEDGLQLVASLSSSVVGNAFGLQDSSAFLDTAGATVIGSLSTVVSIASDAGSGSTVDDHVDSQRRRLTLSTAIDCDKDEAESERVRSTYSHMIGTLHSLSAIASQDALPDEAAVAISASQIRAFAAAGTTLKAPASALAVSLTDPAIACLEPDLFLSAVVLSQSTHSRCKLGNARQISDSTVFMVHSRGAFQAARSGSSSSVKRQSLSSTSLCVDQAAARATEAAASTLQRRLTSNLDTSGEETSVWHPLAVLSIPHSRPLSAVEQRNFTATCQVWNSQSSSWDASVCFYDEATSTPEMTTCYCNQIGTLEVVVTLEEKLDFHALYKDLYRNDSASIIPTATTAILFCLFIVGSKIGQRMDSTDEKKHKEKTIKNLNRAKWGELQERTQNPAVLEDFATFWQRKKRENQSSNLAEQSAAASEATTAASSISLTQDPSGNLASDAEQETRMAEVVTMPTQVDPNIVLPNETRTLFGANKTVESQYARMLGFSKLCNAILVVLGVVLVFVGLDFHFVLGNSTSELLLYVYGKVLGLVLTIFGAVVVGAGCLGLMTSRMEASHISRSTYLTILTLMFIAQLVFVAIAFKYLDDFRNMPSALLSALRQIWEALGAQVREEVEAFYGCCGFVSIKEHSVCPEEALDAFPPRTCSHVLAHEAQAFFTNAFAYLQILFLVEAICITLASILVKWRQLRLLQLAGEPASSATGETSTKRAMLNSQTNVVLLCTLPSLYYMLCCVLVFAVLYGFDMVLQLNYISNALVSALYGIEVGVMLVIGAGIYLLILLRGIQALAFRDIRGLQWFVALSLGFLIVSVGVSQFFWGVEDNLLIDPVIMQKTESRFLSLSRQTLVDLEIAMECCGFDATSEGTCVRSDDAEQPQIRTCRAVVEQILVRGISVFNMRVALFVLVEAAVFVLSVVLLVRLRRFAGKSSSISPQGVQPPLVVDEYHTSWDILVHNACFFVLVLLNLVAAVLGLLVLWTGIDAIYQLNVLHISHLLQTFDRKIGVYLVILGSGLEAFACAGFGTAWKRSRKLFLVYGLTGLVLFVSVFGVLGVAFRFSRHTAFTSEATAFRLEEVWKAAPSTSKVFMQNAFTCCGYDRIEATNGTTTFTDMADVPYWTQVSETTTAYSYSRSLLSASTATKPATTPTRRELTETQNRAMTQPICPHNADTGCSTMMKKYLVRVADYTFKSCIAVLTFLVVVLFCSSVLFLRQGRKTPWTQSWRMVLARVGLLLFAFGSIFASLTTLFIGIDLIARWSIFSSSLLQLLFACSVGIAVLVYACFGLSVNLYSLHAATNNVVHQIFFLSIGRALFALSLWVSVGLTAYLSRFSADGDWESQLSSFLDHKWNTLPPHTQHLVSLDYQCCGFHDPTVVKNKGIVFDRPAIGYTCPLSSARGCHHVLVAQISSSFGWLFVYLLCLAIVETVLLLLGVLLLSELKRIKREEWFAIESRVRYAAGKYRSEARKHHLAFSLLHHYDAKFTRGQRMVSVLCAVLTTLAIYTGYFATQGCHRKSLKTCEQPDVWAVVGMGVVYGGFAGYAAQCGCRLLFELVRHRCDEETTEVATARQRKEKVLLFRSLFQRRPKRSSMHSPTTNDVQGSGAESGSTMDTSHSTTEERWYTWLTRFVYRLFHVVAFGLFLLGCGIGTFMGLVLIGFHDTIYGVKIDQGPKELLLLSLLIALTSLLAWLAVDMKDRKRGGSHVVFIATAIASLLLMTCVLVGVYMVNEVLVDTSGEEATTYNWTIRRTGFSVVERLESAWKAETSGFFKTRVQQELQCCGFRSSSDAAFRPCPTGTTVQAEYEALSVNGSAVMKAQEELVDLGGCLSKMLIAFHKVADTIACFAISICIAQFLLAASGIFLAYDVVISKDSKLKLRVNDERKKDVRLTFEKVVGLKIAAPARGKILSKMISSSLDSVAPTIATELATASLVPQGQKPSSTTPAVSSASKMATPNAPVDSVLSPQRRRSLSLNRPKSLSLDHTHQEEIADVPYPASIVYVVFALCGIWIAIMSYLVVHSSMELGKTTAWECIICWSVGLSFHFLIVEPAVLFLQIIWSTLGTWWQTTWMVRLVRYGREALRIKPDAATAAARYYASLSLYERIRFNAAVRIQRRLVTSITRRRYLQVLRERRQEAHRMLAEQRRLTVKKAIECFTEDEITAFHIIFQDADAAKLGLVSHAVISQSIYQLGVHVSSGLVFKFLHDLDPAYADLVDFEHFLYGMHCVRMHHQEEQNNAAALAATKVEAAEKGTLKEEFVSSSIRFGPGADPQSKILVKRQNVLRELKEKRESLSYKLMSKVGRLPPLLSRGSKSPSKSSPGTPVMRSDTSTSSLRDTSADHTVAAHSLLENAPTDTENADETPPTGAYVILQNRKLSPKKRALEMVLKKKHRDDKSKTAGQSGGDQAGGGETLKSPAKAKSQSPTQRAKSMFQNWKTPSPRGLPSGAGSRLLADSPIATVQGEEETANHSGAMRGNRAEEETHIHSDTRTDISQKSREDGERSVQIPSTEKTLLTADPAREYTAANAIVPADTVTEEKEEPSEQVADSSGPAEAEASEMAGGIMDSAVQRPPPEQETDRDPDVETTSTADEDSASLSSSASSVRLAVDAKESVGTQLDEDAEDGNGGVDDEDKEDEPKPFGTYMLLNKQAPSAGKSKIMENILQKKQNVEATKTPASTKAIGSKDEETMEIRAQSKSAFELNESDAGNGGKSSSIGDEVPSDADGSAGSPPPSRPHTAEKKGAQSSLEKALKRKNLAAKGGGSGGAGGKQSGLRNPATPSKR